MIEKENKKKSKNVHSCRLSLFKDDFKQLCVLVFMKKNIVLPMAQLTKSKVCICCGKHRSTG